MSISLNKSRNWVAKHAGKFYRGKVFKSKKIYCRKVAKARKFKDN